MPLKEYIIQVQDTTTTNKVNINTFSNPQLNSGISIERNTIEIVSLRTLTVDSARLIKPKKVRPIIKTIPLVPENDSIEHPIFNVLENNFLFPSDPTFFDQLNFIPFNPTLKEQVGVSKGEKTLKEKNKKKEITTTVKKDFVIKTNQTNSTGFISTDWMLSVIIFSLILFSWIRVGYSRFYRNAIKASYNYFTARRILEEANVTRSRVFYFMNLLFFVNISLFLSQYFNYNHISFFNLNGILLFFSIFVIIILLYLAKSLFLYLLDFIFLTKGGFSSYVFTVFLYNKMIGFILLPIVSFLPFVPAHVTLWLFVAGALIIIILYVIRIFKGIQLCFKNRLSIFYMILYLCALEILPVMILFKIISSYF